MRRNISTMFGMAVAGMWLVSTFAIAQTPAPRVIMTCTKVDANEYCIEAKSPENKVMVIEVEDVEVGEQVSCVTSGGVTTCKKITKMMK